MTRADWTELAKSIARLRRKLVAHSERDRTGAHLERVIGVDLAARAICRTLKKRSTRFDAERFIQMTRG